MMDDASKNGRTLPSGGGMPPDLEVAAIEALNLKIRLTDERLEALTREVDVLVQDRAALERTLDLFQGSGTARSQAGGAVMAGQSSDYHNQSVGEMIRRWASRHGGVADIHLMSHEFAGYELWPDARSAGRALHARASRMVQSRQAKKIAPSRYRILRSAASSTDDAPPDDDVVGDGGQGVSDALEEQEPTSNANV